MTTHSVGGWISTSTPAWSTVADNNNAPVPNGAPEGMIGSGVDNWGRELMKDIARWNADMDLVATHNSGNILEVTTTRGEAYFSEGHCFGITIAGTALTANTDVYVRVNNVSTTLLIACNTRTVVGADLAVGNKVIIAWVGGLWQLVGHDNMIGEFDGTTWTGYPSRSGKYYAFAVGPLKFTIYTGQATKREDGGYQYITSTAGYSPPNARFAKATWIYPSGVFYPTVCQPSGAAAVNLFNDNYTVQYEFNSLAIGATP